MAWMLAAGVLWAGLVAFGAAPREDQWKQVDEAVKKGLPKTAIEALEPIIAAAVKDQAYAEAIKAIGQKIALEGNIQGNKPEEKITRLQAEIAQAAPELRPVLQAILAHWYWHYFQQNRWRFLQRTATAQPPSDDILTWDLPRILAEIDKHFTAVLAHEAELKKTPVAQYDALLQKGNVPDTYRPTLFDFIAFQALNFYTAGEQAGAKAEDAFDLTADSPIFAAADEFVAWDLKSSDASSLTVRAIKVYQSLLKFHAGDADQAAFLDADLWRLQFGHNQAVGEEKDARYKAALKRFVDQWGDHEISARARFLRAAVLQQEGDLVAAHALAQQGAHAFPTSFGGKSCFNLIQQIEALSIQVSTERVWNEPWPTIQVRYRNATQVHFRLVREDWLGRMKAGRRNRPEQLDDHDRKTLLGKKPDLEWSAKLAATDDFQERTEQLPIPKDLQLGFYFLLASHDPKFSEQQNQVSVTDVWVSTLALVLRPRWGEGLLEGFVLDANSGEPLAQADVQAWIRVDWNNNFRLESTKTDANGLFAFRGTKDRGCIVLAKHQDQQLAAGNEYNIYQQDQQPKPHQQTIFFTDRSLYRPGQTVQYKGICIAVDQAQDNYQTIAKRALTVVFSDPNNKEIARQQHATNDYGSFSGSFTAPRDRLAGRMAIRVEGEPRGGTNFNVEEYKRPKFQVTLEAPKTAPKLNDKASVTGKATAYTGAAIDGAKLRWRVVRQVQYPVWWYWYSWGRTPNTASQELAHGTATTAADGSFTVEFVAKPDLTVAEKDEPKFQFSVTADVTDTTGETRSGQRSINVGYTALKATLAADDWQTDQQPVEITITTQTLDDAPQPAEGVVKVYRLKQPPQVVRGSLSGAQPNPARRKGGGGYPVPGRGMGPSTAPESSLADPANPNSWELGEVAANEGFATDATGTLKKRFQLAPGPYRALLETQDRFGKQVTARLPIQVLQPGGKSLPIKVANGVAGPKWSLEPGEEFMALWGTGYEQGRAFIEIEHRRHVVQAFWTELGATQQAVKQAVTEAHRGGFTIRVTMVRENRGYVTQRQVQVPWTNKQLSVKWEHFVSKLEPAQKETWTAVVTGPDGKKAVAEMVAALYDQSLDAYLPHSWPSQFNAFRYDQSNINSQFENNLKQLQYVWGQLQIASQDATMTYRAFPNDIVANLWGWGFGGQNGLKSGRGLGLAAGLPMAAAPPGVLRERAAYAMDGVEKQAGAMPANAKGEGRADEAPKKPGAPAPSGPAESGAPAGAGPDLSKVAARKNLNETAFFFPHLIAAAEGRVKLEFTMPEALTQWKFLGFAHDSQLRAGFLQEHVVTAKDLMVQPHPPRFLREGDVLEFTVKVTNQSPTRQQGTVQLTLADAATGKSADQFLGNATTDRPFELAAQESKSFAWRLTVPDAAGAMLTYKAVGSTGRLADGEEGILPVLARRVLVTESLPLPIRGPQTKQFEFTRLLKSGESPTLQQQTLTVQMVSNPSWYAVLALPYLMEFPHECSEQVFNRLYANALARHIANSDPKIQAIFEQWKGTPALDSPLEKNQDLKAILLEETPWVRQAQAESQARRNVGVLFDQNRLHSETDRTLRKLAEMQSGDGAWPWFPGGPPNDYITLYITTGFGRLRHLSVKLDMAPAIKSLTRLDAWIDRTYQEILQHGKPDENQLNTTIALYLYGRSFFLSDKPIDKPHQAAVDYFLGQARKYWLQLDCRQSQGHLALALKRFGDKETPQGIMRSVKERSVSNDELGMFWRDRELSWWWYRAPIETQAVMIEAFDEVMHDRQAVEDCQVWLLKQKQTQDWKTTKATADAIFALLLRGENVLASDSLVELTLGGQVIRPEKVEAGTGFYEHRFVRGEIQPKLGQITVKKVDPGVAWGSVHWQYLEDMSKVTPFEGTPLKLKKDLFVREHAKAGPVLQPVKGPLAVGDELVVRLVLRVDRDMEYIHLKDYRGSGTEPVNVLSQYKYQDGLAYYESTRDTASHFFIDYLPKGTYVFEYATRVVHKGQYQTGIASIQCMYAPEFNSHSESVPLVVQ